LSVVVPDVTVTEVPDRTLGSGKAVTSTSVAGPRFAPNITNKEPCAKVVL
jgi:hypothetical protein